MVAELLGEMVVGVAEEVVVEVEEVVEVVEEVEEVERQVGWPVCDMAG